MGLTRQQYEDRIRAELGDLGILQRVAEETIPTALEKALLTFAKDEPRHLTATIAGDGATFTVDLAAQTDWQPGWSRVQAVEYPAGQRSPAYLAEREWVIVDNTLTLLETTPATGENLAIRYSTTWPYPDDNPATDLIPAIYAPAIASLAASTIIRGKAIEAARKQTASVAGTVVQLDPGMLFKAADELKALYEATVLGRPAGANSSGQIGYATSNIEVFPHAIFHRRR